MMNIKNFKTIWKLAQSSSEIKQHVKNIQLLNLIHDFEQVLPTGTAIK